MNRSLCTLFSVLLIVSAMLFSSHARAENLVDNPSFDRDLESWTPYPNSDGKSVVYEGIEKVLKIENPDGSNMGVRQYINLEEKSDSVVYAEYDIKPTRLDSGALVSMDVKLDYDDGSVQYFIYSLRAEESDIGKWRKKELMIIPKRNFTKITVFLLNYNSPSTAYYDNITIELVGHGDDIVISNGEASLVLNTLGYVKSLLYEGEELLEKQEEISTLYFSDGTSKESKSIHSLGNNEYEISYINSDIRVIISIVPENGYFVFRIMRVENPENEELDRIAFFKLYPEHVPQSSAHREWAETTGPDEPFLGIVPLSNNTVFDIKYNKYSCEAIKWMMFENASCAIIASQKSEYYDVFENIVRENGLPYVVLDDGEWIRKSKKTRESYFFVSINEDNYMDVLNYAKTGNFRQVVFIDPLLYGHYNIPKSTLFSDTETFYNALQKFVDEEIKIGIHSFFFRIDYRDPLFDPPNESVYKEQIGSLIEDASSSQTSFQIDNNLENNDIVNHFRSVKDTYNIKVDYYIIGNEIVKCSISGNQLVSCQRGLFGTAKESHSYGDAVYIVPHRYGRFFINPDNKKAINESAASFASFVRRFGINFFYADGYSGPPFPDMDKETITEYAESGMFPYVNAVDRNVMVQLGSGSHKTYLMHYIKRIASWDGVCFKNKEFTKNHKLQTVLKDSPYAFAFHTFGWWRLHGADLGTGRWDYDAVTKDDVSYVITKALATERPIAVEPTNFYERHKMLDEIFSMFGVFNSLAEEDIEKGIIPNRIKEYLKYPEREADLNNISGYNFVEKKTYQRYAVWNNSGGYNFTINNPFAEQKLVAEIRPKFDYYPFSDSRHFTITDFGQASSLDIEAVGGSVSCSLEDGGVLSINNRGSAIGGCKIEIPQGFTMKNKRGIGISLTGDNKNEIVITHLYNSGNGFRDFEVVVNFTGRRDIILGDPTTKVEERIDGERFYLEYSTLRRSWHYDYNWNNVTVYVYTKPGSYTLQFHSLKALQEKPNMLVNPTIEINGEKITFPVTLRIDDESANILEYNGYSGRYTLYTSTYGYVANDTVASPVVRHGENSISVYSDISDPEYSARADIRIFVYDDEDGDGIPTNGSYSDAYVPCTENNNFCDDNCPKDYNPDQKDSDGDGMGDACDVPVSADENGDGKIDIREMVSYIKKWKEKSGVSIKDMLDAVKQWKTD